MDTKIVFDDLGVEVSIKGTTVTSRDLQQDVILDEMILKHPVMEVEVEKESRRIIVKFSPEKKKTIKVKVIGEVARVNTNAEYILDLQLDRLDHGYYFGLYEFGEFILSGNFELRVLKNRRGHPINNGRVLPDGDYVLLLSRSSRELGSESNSRTLLCKGSWKEDSLYHWSHLLDTASRTIEMASTEMILVGLKNGKIEAWNVSDEQKEWELTPFSSWILNFQKVILHGTSHFIASSDDGKLALFSENGEMTWTMQVSPHFITAMEVDPNNSLVVHCIDGKMTYHQVDLMTGKLLAPSGLSLRDEWIHSKMAIMRGWLFVAWSYGMLGFYKPWLSSPVKSFSVEMVDPYIRSFRSHPQGIYTGDDEGVLKFWRLGQLSFY